MKVTAAPWVQLQAGSNGVTSETGGASAEYFDDAVVGAKFHLVDQADAMPSMAASLEWSVPTFSGQVGYVRTVDASPVTAKDGGVLFAFTHAPRTWLVFDLGGDVGLFPGSRSYSAFLGMSIIPVVLWRP